MATKKNSSKEKKPSIDQLAKEAITLQFKESGNELWLLATVKRVKGTLGSNYNAAFYNEGIKIYEFNKSYENKIIEIENHTWSKWTSATVDHFAIKSIFNFQNESDKFTLISNEKGKQIVQIVKSKTPIALTVTPRSWWRKILGFRSKTKWKMVTATLIYLILLGSIANAFTGHSEATASATANAQQLNQQSTNNSAADAKVKADPQVKADADAKAKADADAQTKVDSDAKAKADAESKAKADDVAYLNAVNKITYNTFVEAQNIGDQMKQLSSYQESMDDFANFVDTDVALWGMYLNDIQSTNPNDPFLYSTKQEIMKDLNDLKENATAMRDSSHANDTNKVVKASQNMLIAFNHIKQHYGEPVSQMDEYGISPNWRPN